MNQLLNIVKNADESYLCALANKGLYKRALRELSETEVKTELVDDRLKAVFSDGTETVIEHDLQNYRCSCPSRSICKHVLMAVLAAQKEADQITSEAVEESEKPQTDGNSTISSDVFVYLLDTKPDQLRKLAGKRIYQKAVLGLDDLGKAEIAENSTLKVLFADHGIQVHFLPQSSLETATCSCKQTGFCIHKTSAVLRYVEKKTGALPEGFQPDKEETAQAFSTDTVPLIAEFAESIFSTGLVRLGEDVAARFGQIAVICHSQRLADMERLCSRIEGRLKRYYARSAAFDQDGLVDDLCRLSELCEALSSGAAGQSAAGVFREQYHPVSTLELYGLGALGWYTESGYTGVSVYFYDSGGKQVLEYASVMPDDGGKTTPQKLFQASAPWGVPARLAAVAHSKMQLSQAKVNRKQQLSASAETTAKLEGATDLLGEALAELQYTDFKAVAALLWQRMQEDDSQAVILLVPDHYGKPEFDQVEQRLVIPVHDSQGRTILLSVKHEGSGRQVIANLKWLAGTDQLSGPVLARVQLVQGQLTALPVTLFTREGPLNLSLAKNKDKKTAVRHRFDWGKSGGRNGV